MSAEIVAIVLVVLAPAVLFLGWLALMAAVVAALGASTDGDFDEIKLLRTGA